MKYEFKGTPGPWRWELNEKSKDINLCGGKPMYDLTVMDFVRYGMGGAAPRFRRDIEGRENLQIMERVEYFGEIAKGREHHKEWFKHINQSDANLIAAAPELLNALINLLDVYDHKGELIDTDVVEIINQARKAVCKALNEGGQNG